MGCTRVTLETRPEPLNTVILAWWLWAKLTSVSTTSFPAGIWMKMGSINMLGFPSITTGGLGLFLEPKGLPFGFLEEDEARNSLESTGRLFCLIGNNCDDVGVGIMLLLVVEVMWVTMLFSLLDPTMTDELPESVSNLSKDIYSYSLWKRQKM